MNATLSSEVGGRQEETLTWSHQVINEYNLRTKIKNLVGETPSIERCTHSSEVQFGDGVIILPVYSDYGKLRDDIVSNLLGNVTLKRERKCTQILKS